MPRNLPARPGVVVHAPQVVAVRHRGERAVEWKNLEAVPCQIELADDLGPQQRHDIRADRKPEAGKYLFGDRGAAQHVAPFEDQHLPPDACQVGRGGQPVVAAANDDRVITHVWALYSSGPGGADCGHSHAVLSRWSRSVGWLLHRLGAAPFSAPADD